MNKIRIVAAVVDTRQLTLYKEDGSTVVLPQGDPRVRMIVDTASEDIIRQGWAEVDLSRDNVYQVFEKKSGGMVRLFRIARDKFKELLTGETVPTGVVGVLPTPPQKTLTAVEEVMQNAVPSTDPNFEQNTQKIGTTPSKDTIVAVVGDKVIGGMESIKPHFAQASTLGSTKGVERFLARLATVIDDRGHSVQDLLRFMEKGDLPIAEDGSILIYKVLKWQGKRYVDCHTGKVSQYIGSYVCMDEALIDRRRTVECSNGLHVARRDYIRGFSGNVCVLAKVAPEDVIAVPEHEPSKMRVCGYHILFELTPEQHELLRNGKPITELKSGAELLGKALAGHHPDILEEVRITGRMGENVVVTSYKTKTTVFPDKVPIKPVKALDPEMPEQKDTPINPKEVAKTVEKLSHREHLSKEFARFQRMKSQVSRKKLAQAMLDYKRQCKKGWAVLGMSPEQVQQLHDAVK